MTAFPRGRFSAGVSAGSVLAWAYQSAARRKRKRPQRGERAEAVGALLNVPMGVGTFG
jgi:hypothetical protein